MRVQCGECGMWTEAPEVGTPTRCGWCDEEWTHTVTHPQGYATGYALGCSVMLFVAGTFLVAFWTMVVSFVWRLFV